jgi:RHS repeat-associated protein
LLSGAGQNNWLSDDFFNMEMHYDKGGIVPGATPYYNGNISEWIWKGAYDEYVKAYYYQYDQANRMQSTNYQWRPTGNSGSFQFTAKYDEQNITYDHNGNFLRLDRYHGDWLKINSLYYNLYNGNQLGRVQDLAGSGSTIGFQDKSNPVSPNNDYTYDANGNLTSDYNKSITSITYNYLNLPNVVTITSKGTITYTYDAAGNKLQKTTLDQTVTPNRTTNYYYAGDYVYRSAATGSPDTLEFISHPEGRLRPVRIDTTKAISITNLKYIYDYFLKDQLGSVRNVLTTEQETDLYAATMETAAAAKENALFNNVSSAAVTKPGGFDTNNSNGMVSQLNGNINVTGNSRVGPSIILKVMAGDTISISAYGWYVGAVQPPATGVSAIVNDLLPLLTNGIVADGGTHGGAIPSSTYNPLITAALDSFLQYNQPYDNTRPKAFLNWVIVDEEFKKVSSANHAGSVQIPLITGSMQAQQMVGPANMVVRRNGYLYVYLSNESNQNVDFDNLIINQTRGPLLEQKDYYAFGLEIPGLCTQSIKQNYISNRNRYSGKELQSNEFTDGTSLTWDDFGARMYDPEIGRWMRPDPLSDKMRKFSTYNYVFDNPIRFIDPDGMGPTEIGIVGDASFRSKTFNDLQKLTSTKLVLLDNGVVTQANNVTSSDKVELAGTPQTNVTTGQVLNKPVGTAVVNNLINTQKLIVISESPDGQDRTHPEDKVDAENGQGTGSSIEYNPDNTNSDGFEPIVNADGTTGAPAAIFLAHELFHGEDNNNGTHDQTASKTTDPDTKTKGVLSNSEVKIRAKENEVRKENNVVERANPY